MSFLFDKLFQKQDPEIASRMAQHGLIFDKNKRRWVKGTQPDANVTGGESSEIPGMEGPFRYKTGNTYYYSPKEGKYYDRGQDVFMPRGFDPHTGQYHQDIEEARREKEKSKPLVEDTQDKKKVSDTIIEQLSGSQGKYFNRFKLMTGAKNFSYDKDGLYFRIARSKQGINSVSITLDSNDTYTMEFQRIHGTKIKSIEKVSGIQAANLIPSFEDATGLAINFGSKRML